MPSLPFFVALRRFVAATALFTLVPTVPVGAQSATTATIVGSVTDVASGLSLPNVPVTLYRASTIVTKTVTDQSGTFRFADVAPAVYRIDVRADGYGSSLSDDIAVAPGRVNYNVNLARATGSSGQELRTIGSTSVNSTLGGGLQRTSTVSEDISTDLLSRQNYPNIGEGLTTLPGVNNTGHSSTVGDDTYLSLRGFDPSESQTLLDGHPIGPIGVGGGFNYQISPFFVLRNTQVTFGAGALGLYGTDATGGAIDLQTLNPTRERDIAFSQGIGTQGKLLSALSATGTVGKLGYAFAGATQGLYGNFKPQQITQTGNLGFDVSPGNVAANTHLVTGNYSLRDGLAKLQYEFFPGTVATITAYTAHSRDDKSGVGDNDYQPFGPELAIAQGIATAPNGPASNPTACGVGTVAVTINNAGSIACQTPAQAAAGSYGPSGGGSNPFQDIVNQDYHGRLVSNVLGNSISIDGYVDEFNVNYNRNGASELPNGTFTGGFNQSLYKTNGFLVSDDLPHGNNDFGFGYFTQHQTYDSNQFDTTNLVIVPNPQLFLATDNVFLRDTFSPTPWLTLYTNVYYKLLSTTGSDTVDPRATLLLRPTPRDVVRIVAGKTDGEPSAGLAQTQFNNTPSNINPSGSCSSLIGLPSNASTATAPGQIGVGNLAGNGLQQETATDYELTYGHQFTDGSSFQVGGYVSRAANLITSINVPVTPGLIPNNLLQQYFARIQQSCGSSYVGTLADLSLNQAVNGTTSGLYRGLTLSGRERITRYVALNYQYDLQHAQIFGYSDSNLMGNADEINGGQVGGVPLNSGSLGAEFDNHHGLDARIDGYYYGINNGYHRPAYGFANLSVQYQAKTGTELSLGINNLTQSAYQQYGYFNAGVAGPVNSFYTNNQISAPEEFGLPPRQILFTLTQHVH